MEENNFITLNNIKYEWLGQSTVRITADDGFVIYTDPVMLDENPAKADLILITHHHVDHCLPEFVSAIRTEKTKMAAFYDSYIKHCAQDIKGVRTVKIGQTISLITTFRDKDLSGVKITGIEAYAKKGFHMKGEGCGFLIEIKGQRIYFSGDTARIKEMEDLKNIDAAIVSICDNIYAIDTNEIIEAVKNMKPKLFIPVHFTPIDAHEPVLEKGAMATKDPRFFTRKEDISKLIPLFDGTGIEIAVLKKRAYTGYERHADLTGAVSSATFIAMKKIAVIISIFTIFILALFYIKFAQKEKIADYIETTGIIEALEAELSPKISDRITWLCCKEGDIVKADSPAIRLDDKELKARVFQGKEALNVAKASVDVSRANLENAKLEVNTLKAEVQAAEAEIARMNALTEDARKNMQRVERLFKDGLISEKDMDAAKTNYDANFAQSDSAKARKMAADARLKNSIANIKIFEAQLSSTKTKVLESQAALSLLETQLKDTEIIFHVDGVIVHKAFELGEMASAGASIYTIHDLKNIWARVDIEETSIGRIKLGSKADVFLESMPQKGFSGEVIEIGREAGFATQRDVTRGRSDIKTFRVKVGIKESDGLLKPGMTVRARINY